MFSGFRKSLFPSKQKLSIPKPPGSFRAASRATSPNPDILHYPAKNGDLLAERYRLKTRLGAEHGTRSTVWLSDDMQTGHECVSKIIASEATPIGKHAQREVQFLERVAQRGSHPNVMRLYGHKTVMSEHGAHACAVLDVLGPSLQNLEKLSPPLPERQMWPMPACREIIRQLLCAVNFLHSECGIIHTDIKNDNILLRPENVKGLPVDWSPFDLSGLQIGPSSVVLSDLGSAIWADQPFNGLIQPFGLRAPEVFLRGPFTSAVDIWNIGVIAFELIIRGPMFLPEKTDRWTPVEDILTQMMCFAQRDRFPLDLLESGKDSEKLFDMKTGKLKNPNLVPGGEPMSAALCWYRPSLAHESSLPLLADFLDSMIQLCPQDRPTAAQLLKHDWLCE